MEWSNKDLQQIQQHDQNKENIEHQIKSFVDGFPPIKLAAAATLENKGIKCILSPKNGDALWVDFFDKASANVKKALFVPASGAASRMFKPLFSFINDGNDSYTTDIKEFLDNITHFAFYDELKETFSKKGKKIEIASDKEKITALLSSEGLDYGNKPKGLLLFHHYLKENRFAIEEHLVEGALYGISYPNKVYIHFTVSPEHQNDFFNTVQKVKEKHEKKYGVEYDISFSQQKPSTDTIAVNIDNTPFRNDDNTLLFRPGGHGALIENLNDIDADIIFIKNIDNVVPDQLKKETVRYKKILGGILLHVVATVKNILTLLESDAEKGMQEAIEFIDSEFNLKPSANFINCSKKEQIDWIIQYLNRPIRVCGMVKNEGEPGGGPFFVYNPKQGNSLQIVESSQIDNNDAEQIKIAKSATHFNPVDLVCCVKDFKGNRFDLKQFVDPTTGFISEKSKDGKPLKAQELPGLWNGAMANWLTIFVEVPLITFNPVKTVNDLLRKEHQ